MYGIPTDQVSGPLLRKACSTVSASFCMILATASCFLLLAAHQDLSDKDLLAIQSGLRLWPLGNGKERRRSVAAAYRGAPFQLASSTTVRAPLPWRREAEEPGHSKEPPLLLQATSKKLMSQHSPTRWLRPGVRVSKCCNDAGARGCFVVKGRGGGLSNETGTLSAADTRSSSARLAVAITSWSSSMTRRRGLV